MNKFSIIIPESIGWLHLHIEHKLIEEFGGYSVFPIRGGWKNSSGDIQSENSSLYFAITVYNNYQLGDFGQELARYIKSVSEEEEVLFWTEEIKR